jgi:RNA 2',3'-cyclic 3'-phosphodiesterase
MRLFVALALSVEVRKNLTALLAELRQADPQLRWVSPANLHITLKFIGEVAAEMRPAIEQALTSFPTPPSFELEFRDIGFFPSDRRPTVVWVGIQAPPALSALAADIDHALAACGIARDTRPFAPHLTLARFKEARLSQPLRAQIEKSQNRSFGRQPAAEFHLIESKLRSTGAEYTTLRSFPLAAEGN